MNWPTLARGEAHSRPFRAGRNAPTGAHGDRGGFPTNKDSPSITGGSYNRVVRLPPIPFHRSVNETQVSLPTEGCGRYTPPPRIRGLSGMLHLCWNRGRAAAGGGRIHRT